MRNMRAAFVLVALYSMVGCVGCRYVRPGYVGVIVNAYGTNRGVDDTPIVTGQVWYNPFTTSIHEFPTFCQNVVWSDNEGISFNSKEGAPLNADVGLSYTIKHDAVSHVFNDLRQDMDYITATYMRTKVRDAINRHSVHYTAIDIYGEGRNKLLVDAKKDLEEQLGNRFVFDTVTFIGKIRGDAMVEASINQTIQATQMAISAENKVKQITAEAEQAVAKAKGEASAILAKAEAEAQANEMLTKSLSPALMSYKALEKWDGVLPKVTGETVPFISIDTKEK